MTIPRSDEIVALLHQRTDEVTAAVSALAPADLEAPSRLSGWSRLTIACHLRYGAQATAQVIDASMRGRASAFYPGGRDLQRERTLQPALGESGAHVPESLREVSTDLDHLVADLPATAWSIPVIPADDDVVDLTVGDVILLRLTEMMVHGSDLALDLRPWPPRFGDAVIAQRLARLRCAPAPAPLRLVLETDQGEAWTLHVDPDGTASFLAGNNGADARLVGPAVSHVAHLLGRTPDEPLQVHGERSAALAFVQRVVGP